jgi:hypothetical protein
MTALSNERRRDLLLSYVTNADDTLLEGLRS